MYFYPYEEIASGRSSQPALQIYQVVVFNTFLSASKDRHAGIGSYNHSVKAPPAAFE
ncbi:hypothetical protein [Collimonas fungivorans]|uniref:hypothetical protein n=1 Tax=Collimonas fungivorans TaxID=158899 RepID=UPI00167FA2BF|nr:hypothetical protein [Collimonas fungivorans]